MIIILELSSQMSSSTTSSLSISEETTSTTTELDQSVNRNIAIFSSLGAAVLIVICVLFSIAVVCVVKWRHAKQRTGRIQGREAVSNPVYDGEFEVL